MTIKEKANKAIQETGAGLTEHKVKVVTHLRNGGILLELNSSDTVKWLQDKETHKTFLRKYMQIQSLSQDLSQSLFNSFH
jgi:hypothetical protein